MKHLIVGTAGHVDHGKTALIKYLTGTDTDRLKEEKNRGISIDIGFAVLRCEEEIVLGIVDVPGHERFLKNMLAGTGSIDLALLVIAADEGIMPQTREHFEMLQCFGVKKGIIVITKIDKVDLEWLSLIEEEIRDYLAGSFLSDAPLCKVSSVSGAGIDELKEVMQAEAKKVVERDIRAPFRLWIDRAFNLRGQGLIVTGSVLSGSVNTGDSIVIYPAGSQVKIREIESHNQNVTRASAGQRASFKLAGLSLTEAERGMVLSAPGYGQKSKGWECIVAWKSRFPSGTRVRFHIGTGEFIGRMAYKETDEKPETLARLYLEEPIVAGLGDRGLLRRYSPQNLIGGVILLSPLERGSQKKAGLARLAGDLKKDDQAGVMNDLLELSREPLNLNEWMTRGGYGNASSASHAVSNLLKGGKVKQAGNFYLTVDQFTQMQISAKEYLTEYHRQKPSEIGISREILRHKIHLPNQIADWFLQETAEQGLIKIHEEFVALPTHAARHVDERSQLVLQFEKLMPVQELVEITPEWLADKLHRPISEMKPFFDTLIREKMIIRLTGVHVYRKTIQYIGSVIQHHFQSHETLSVGELRDLLNTSRRLVIPVLEYFDLHKYTIRKDDNRVPGPNLTNLSE